MRIGFVYQRGRLARRARVRRGEVPTEFFYGGVELDRAGHAVDLHELGGRAGRALWQRAADRLLRWRLLPSRTGGTVLGELLALCPKLQGCDVVVATTTAIGYGLGTLKLLGRLGPPLVAIHCGLVNYRHRWFRRRANGLVLRRTWTQLYGEGERDEVLRVFGVPPERVAVNQFGVDVDFWTPGGSEGGYVLSVGNDARRDYELLVEAVGRVGCEAMIVTAREIGTRLPPTVRKVAGGWHEEAVTDGELRDLYRGAQFVVIPLHDSLQPSGQSVCLQAMACGKPVVMTRTRGLWSRRAMRDGENVILVPPGDVGTLAETMRGLLQDAGERRRLGRNAREAVCRDGDIKAFAARLEEACRRAIAEGR